MTKLNSNDFLNIFIVRNSYLVFLVSISIARNAYMNFLVAVIIVKNIYMRLFMIMLNLENSTTNSYTVINFQKAEFKAKMSLYYLKESGK